MAAMSPARIGTASAESSQPVGSPSPDDPDLERMFRQLADEWLAAVAHLSSTTARVQHPTYREIVALGPPVVPLLLRELERRPNHWFAALRSLTDADPVAPAERGHLDRMAESWIQWARSAGRPLKRERPLAD
jgi:hypothetical protein